MALVAVLRREVLRHQECEEGDGRDAAWLFGELRARPVPGRRHGDERDRGPDTGAPETRREVPQGLARLRRQPRARGEGPSCDARQRREPIYLGRHCRYGVILPAASGGLARRLRTQARTSEARAPPRLLATT